VIAGRSLQGWLDRADELAGAGRFFDAHEELELAWKAADGDAKILLQGLIQIAAGLHRLGLHPEKTGGAFYLLDRGLEKVRRTRALLAEETVDGFENRVRLLRKTGAAPSSFRFGLRAR
jgi:predicted metal-dependent hydrolase